MLFPVLEKFSLFRLTDLLTLVLLVWKWMGLFLKKKTLLEILELSFFPELDWCSYNVSIAKTASNEIGALIRSMKILSTETPL